MGETADLKLTAEASLRSILPVLEDIPRVAEEWGRWSEQSQERFYLEWDELMDRLEFLGEMAHTGQMTAEQVARYECAVGLVREMTPLLSRLELQHPEAGSTAPAESRRR